MMKALSAIALVCGDRFYTSSFSASTLTTWGYQDQVWPAHSRNCWPGCCLITTHLWVLMFLLSLYVTNILVRIVPIPVSFLTPKKIKVSPAEWSKFLLISIPSRVPFPSLSSKSWTLSLVSRLSTESPPGPHFKVPSGCKRQIYSQLRCRDLALVSVFILVSSQPRTILKDIL